MKELETIDAETLLYKPLEQVEVIIEDILPTGLHLFCGASKIGKSWLMLKICLQVVFDKLKVDQKITIL